jgi:hypothetical protein
MIGMDDFVETLSISILIIKNRRKLWIACLTLKLTPIVPNLFEAFRASIELSETVSAAFEIHKKN